MYLGWTQVAFESDLTQDVVPVDCGGRASSPCAKIPPLSYTTDGALIVVRTSDMAAGSMARSW